jgi:hypothetical protein
VGVVDVVDVVDVVAMKEEATGAQVVALVLHCSLFLVNINTITWPTHRFNVSLHRCFEEPHRITACTVYYGFDSFVVEGPMYKLQERGMTRCIIVVACIIGSSPVRLLA